MKIWWKLLEPQSQAFILFQSSCQNLPDIHTFFISISKLARCAYFFSLIVKICLIVILFPIFSKFGRLVCVNCAQLKKFQNLILKCLIPLEPERALKCRRSVSASSFNYSFLSYTNNT